MAAEMEVIGPHEEESGKLVKGSERDAMSIATARASQEVQAAMVIAKKFPRDVAKSRARILEACRRPTLADKAVYEYPRGGTMIEGPSIRLAEVMAQAWGNVDFGITELAQDGNSSVVMSYCHDLETNARQVKTFTVTHIRHTRKGSYKLTDSRDIYEMVANQGARRLRACILGIIPGDIQEEALNECNRVILDQSDRPLADQITQAIDAFAKLGVDEQMLRDKMGVKSLDALTLRQVARLRRIYQAIVDGIGSLKAYFPRVDTAAEERASALREKLKARKNGASTKTAPAPAAQPADEPPLEDGESFDHETGEISSDEPPANEEQQTLPTQSVDPNEPTPRERLVTEYMELCETKGVEMKSVRALSTEAIRRLVDDLKSS